MTWMRPTSLSTAESPRSSPVSLNRRARTPVGRIRRLSVAQGDRREPLLGVAVSISDAIKRFDLLELAVNLAELAADSLDVAVDRAVVDINRLAVRRIHQLLAILHVAGPLREGLQEKELGHRKVHLLALPGALMAAGVEHQLAAHDALGRALGLAAAAVGAAQYGANALQQQALGEWLADEAVG